MTIMQADDFTVLVEGLDHPECVTWGPDGQLYAGGEAGQIYRVALDGSGLTEIGTTAGFILGVCLDGDGNVYACDPGNLAVMRVTASGEVSTYSSGLPDRPFVNPNFGVFDRAGNLYVSDSGGYHKDNGCLWVVRADGTTELADDTLTAFPNGIALDADERHLYLAMSTVPGVVRVPVADGRVTGPAEPVCVLERTVPDGLAFDVEGNLFVSCYTPDVIFKVDPSGAVETLVEDWERSTLAAPTNISFAGADLRTLVVANLGRWHLASAELPVAGQPFNYPRLGS
jgi:gluconolactonase